MVSCIDLPDSPEIKGNQLQKFNGIKQYLGIKNYQTQYSGKKSKGIETIVFSIDLIDVKNKHPNMDSINFELIDVFEKSGYDFSRCKKISIWYFNRYDNADLKKVFFYDNKMNLLEVAYD